jgi:hypothetical protein
MRRRQFITLVGGAAGRMTAWREQQSKNIPAVGVLWHAGSAEETNDQIVCYDAITALTERFCQNAPRPEANGGQVQGLRLAGPTWPPTNYSCRYHWGRRRRTPRRRAGTAAGSPRMNWGLAADLIGLPVVGFGNYFNLQVFSV